jgi:hypothetical protein
MLGLKKKYLSAPLDQYKYIKIPLASFPDLIKIQYNLNSLALDCGAHENNLYGYGG